MPKGLQGQKRPIDAIANAVNVTRIATGEIEEDGYDDYRPKGSVGEAARTASLSSSDY